MEESTNIQIDPELKALITPLSTGVRAGLEQDLLRDGCRDPLVVWVRPEDGKRLLLDATTVRRFATNTTCRIPRWSSGLDRAQKRWFGSSKTNCTGAI
jgi:hypothetical protein